MTTTQQPSVQWNHGPSSRTRTWRQPLKHADLQMSNGPAPSNPLAATSVATSTRAWPLRKSIKASSRSCRFLVAKNDQKRMVLSSVYDQHQARHYIPTCKLLRIAGWAYHFSMDLAWMSNRMLILDVSGFWLPGAFQLNLSDILKIWFLVHPVAALSRSSPRIHCLRRTCWSLSLCMALAWTCVAWRRTWGSSVASIQPCTYLATYVNLCKPMVPAQHGNISIYIYLHFIYVYI